MLLALEGLQADEALAGLATEGGTLAEETDQARTLDLLLEPLLQAIIGLFAFLVCVDCHTVDVLYGE